MRAALVVAIPATHGVLAGIGTLHEVNGRAQDLDVTPHRDDKVNGDVGVEVSHVLLDGNAEPDAVRRVRLSPPVHRGSVEQDVLDQQVVDCNREERGEERGISNREVRLGL